MHLSMFVCVVALLYRIQRDFLAPLHIPTPSPNGGDSMTKMVNHDEESIQRILTKSQQNA